MSQRILYFNVGLDEESVRKDIQNQKKEDDRFYCGTKHLGNASAMLDRLKAVQIFNRFELFAAFQGLSFAGGT